MNALNYQNALDLLNETHQWPCPYVFKFIVPQVQLSGLYDAIEEEIQPTLRPSSGGKYVSVTFSLHMSSGEAVLAIYKKVQGIPGLLSL